MDKAPKYQHIEQYIAAQPVEVQTQLNELFWVIQHTLPQASPCISYNMPCFKQNGMICYFAAFKKHYSLFFSPAVVQYFQQELGDYVHSKSAIQIPLGKSFPTILLKNMLLHTAELNRKKAEHKKQPRKK
jgi:uncharacterized protein YdhG (YjbR/CyaY superfamily)